MSRIFILTAILALLMCPVAYATSLQGDALETVADIISSVVLVFTPVAVIYLFWMVHFLPEKIAERRKHPQAPAIKALCLLSLLFGGLLWPLAWLWAYSKPTLFQLAYGRDRLEHHEHDLPPQHWTPTVEKEPANLAALSQAIASLDSETLLRLQAQIEHRLQAEPPQDEEEHA